MMAAKMGNVGIVRKLIHHGANVNLTNKVNFKLCAVEFEHSNMPKNCMSCMSTKTMRFKSSKVLELWLSRQFSFCITNFVNFSGFCSPMVVLVISSFFEHDELIKAP